MRLRSHVRNAFEQGQIFGMLSKFVIADQGTERSATKNAVLFFVTFLKSAL